MIYSIPYSNKKNSRLPLVFSLIGYNHLQEPVYRPQGVPFFQWFFCCKGQGEFTSGEYTSHIHKGQGFLVYANTSHSYKGLTPDFSIHVLGFTGVCAAEILRTCGMYETGIYQISNETVFTRYIQSALSLHSRNLPEAQQEYSKLCYGFLCDMGQCIQKINTPPITQNNETIRCITDYLEEHYNHPISLDDLAREINLTKSYMCTLFKKEMHFSIVHYLLLIRIGWARLYLEQYPERNVYDIGKMCGFESPSYFGKKFKEIVGVTPESYKYVSSIRI